MTPWVMKAVFLTLAVPALAQKSGCDLVTQSEAASILGSAVDKQAFGTTCIYKMKGTGVSLVVKIAKNSSAAVSSTKASFAKVGGTVKDEPGLGAGAYSAVRADSSRVYVFKGDQMLMVDYTDIARAKAPAGMLEKLKAAAKTGLGRL